jgi:hypothetical protein
MTSSTGFRAQMAADCAHCRMKKETDVAHREPGNGADFPVAQAALEPEIHDLALVAREGRQELEDLAQRLARVVPFIEIAGDGNVDVVEGRAAGGVPARVERQVPADCEQPRGHVFPDALPVLPAQAEECLLHDIARRVQVAEQPLRIAEQRSLVRLQCFDHPFGFRRPGHAPSKETTDQGRFY